MRFAASHDEFVARITAFDLPQVAAEYYFAVVEYGYVVAKLFDVVHLVTAEQHYFTVVYHFADDVLQQERVYRVKPRKGLVQHYDVGIVAQGGYQLNFLLIALAQRFQAFVAVVGHTESVKPFVYGNCGFAL